MKSWDNSLPNNSKILFSSLEEILDLHQKSSERFGGAAGVRDLGLVESTLYRPQTGYYEDLASMAAAMMESFLLNHAFVDGNKRIAFFATDTFLRMNGYKIKITAKKGYDFIIDVIENSEKRFERLKDWIEKYSVKL